MMDLEKLWEKAFKNTEVLRARIQSLSSHTDTHVPYIFLAESQVNLGDTVVRKGEILVQKPALFIPPHNPQFEGFNFEGEMEVDTNSLVNFLIVRGIALPSLKYDNQTHSIEIFEGKLDKAVKEHLDNLQRLEDVGTGLLTGPEDVWQMSLLIFVCTQIMRNSQNDIRHLLDQYRKRLDS